MKQKAARTAAIQQAAVAAADVPMQIAEKSMEVLLLARRIIVTGNPNAISDGTVSAIVARAALRSALYNVKLTLGLLKTPLMWSGQRPKCRRWRPKRWKRKLLCWRVRMKF